MLRKVLLIMLSVAPMAWAQVNCKPDNLVASTPLSRFTIHGDGTVTDLKTGLMWKQCSEGFSGDGCLTGRMQNAFWDATLNSIKTLNEGNGFAGYKDWRLPNIKELHSIVEAQCYRPAVNLDVFPNTQIAKYFSSSLVKDIFRDQVWAVEYEFGRVERHGLIFGATARLVRNAK